MRLCLACAIFILSVFPAVSLAEETDTTATAPRCLSMSKISRIEVVDDQTLIFHLYGSKKYVNHLPHKCSGLKRNTLLHETSLNAYCDLDIIKMVDTNTRMRLGSCSLGKFEVYTVPDKNAPEEKSAVE